MKESVLQFGENQGLIGVVTEPPFESRTSLGVILMNSGLIHRIGPNRIYVGLARQLAARGFTVLRMDFSGLGDSGVRRDHLPYEKSSLLEAREAMDELGRRYGIDRFLLAGICSGAEASVQIAEVDERVVGIVPIEFYGYETRWYRLYSYHRRLLRARSWRRLVTGRSELLDSLKARLASGGGSGEVRSAAPPSAGTTPAMPVQQRRERVVESFRALANRGVRTCLVYGAGSAHFNYRTLFRRSLRDLERRGLLEVIHLEGSDHTFTLIENQQLLRDAVVDWLSGAFGAQRLPSSVPSLGAAVEARA